MTPPALVLDFGGPVLLTPFELVADEPGTPAYALLHRRGPLATTEEPDPVWEDLQAGQITERAYWRLPTRRDQYSSAAPSAESFVLRSPPKWAKPNASR